MQRDFADLKEEFTDSILKITSKGMENYEDIIRQSESGCKIRLKILIIITQHSMHLFLRFSAMHDWEANDYNVGKLGATILGIENWSNSKVSAQ